jgi:Domain of unknown function (DUF4382)/Carboxypeptidase regulatory-like domain
MHGFFRFTTFPVALLATLACADSSGTRMGLLTVRLTDAPFPFSEVASVDVFVTRIEAKKAAPTEDDGDESDRGGWTTIATPNASYNLLDLANGVTTNLGEEMLPTGTYRGFRLVLDTDRSTITLKDGSSPEIDWPSAGQSGIKVKLDMPIELDEDGSVMTLDFDVGRSFVMRGNTIDKGFNFRPVIRAVAEDITGSVIGSVRANSTTGAAVVGATVEVLTAGSLINDADPTHIVRTAATDANGDFRIAFLLPGSYVLRVTPPAASGLKPALHPGNFTVISGAETLIPVIVVTP